MAATRKARAIWSGDLAKGQGRISGGSSEHLRDAPISWSARTESADGKTSPEELLAAAHASCFAMALSAALAKNGTPPERLDVTATVRFDKVLDAWAVTSSELELRASVPDIDEETFTRLAQDAKDGCPISKALKGNVALSVTAKLEPAESRV
jgi:osmotically inducible protein OsmC